MNLRLKKTWLAAVGLALAVTTAGVAVALPDDPAGWYDGDNATVPDPYKTATTLKLYNGSGVEVTTGSTADPLAAFAAAGGDVRAGDDHASLFVHLPQSGATPGAWPGVQATGTDKFSGTGAVTAPGSLSGKPYVGAADGYTLADAAAALPNTETSASFVGVYELRLRTSSVTGGVSDTYAATYLKITGSTWAVTDPPVLGGGSDPEPVATTVTATWPAKITYGTAATVPVRVTPASGSANPTGTVRLLFGSTVLSSATLSPTGTASLAVSRTALAPGSRVLRVAYLGATDTFLPSESAPRTFPVAKAAPGKPALRVTKKPTGRATGTATVTVPVSAGLVKPTGSVRVVLTKGRTSRTVTGAVRSGVARVTLPKLPAGTWTVRTTYLGNAYYTSAAAAATRLVTRAR